MGRTALMYMVFVASESVIPDPVLCTQNFTFKGKRNQEGPRDVSSLGYLRRAVPHHLPSGPCGVITIRLTENQGDLCSKLDSATNFLRTPGKVTQTFLASVSFCGKWGGWTTWLLSRVWSTNMRCFSLAYKYILLNSHVGLLGFRKNCN